MPLLSLIPFSQTNPKDCLNATLLSKGDISLAAMDPAPISAAISALRLVQGNPKKESTAWILERSGFAVRI
jgi:hypothetical protein